MHHWLGPHELEKRLPPAFYTPPSIDNSAKIDNHRRFEIGEFAS
jgi:hypothetical protein